MMLEIIKSNYHRNCGKVARKVSRRITKSFRRIHSHSAQAAFKRATQSGISSMLILLKPRNKVFGGQSALSCQNCIVELVANANLLTNLTLFTVIPISYILFKEKIPKYFLVGAAITIIGVFVLIGGKLTPSMSNYFGDSLALCASFFYAGFLLISYHLRSRIESSVIMFISAFGSALTLLMVSFFVEGIQVPNGSRQLWPLFGLTLCLQVIGHNLLAHCQGKISVNLSSIVCLCQPAIASIYSFFIFSETISAREITGIVIVMVGVYLVKTQYKHKGRNE